MSDFLSTNELDFDTLKQNLKTFLKNQQIFQDLDFEGSNLNVLLDVLAYNTYLNAYYLNVVGNESFLDSTKLRDSAISHAKELGYIPKSRSSARALVQLTATTNDPTVGQIVVPRNTKFTATGTTEQSISQQFTFLTDDDTILRRISDTEFRANTFVYEGSIVTERYTVTGEPSQRFIISNRNVDTDSIRVSVQASQSDTTNNIFTKTETLFGLTNASPVYFLQAYPDERYEIIFGDGIFGKKLSAPNQVNVEYRVTNGIDSNGCRLFKIGTFTGSSAYPINVVTLENAAAGSDRETIDSIKFNAPRHFQAQQRAITTDDYKTLIKDTFNEVTAVNAYGGEELQTPQYGRVFISAATQTGSILSNTRKQEIIDFVKSRNSLSLEVEYIDPIFLDLLVNTTVLYRSSLTNKTINQIRDSVSNSISQYNSTNLLDFDKDFRYSKFVTAIDGSDNSIVSNDTEVLLVKSVTPILNRPTSFVIDFQNSIIEDDFNSSPRPETNIFSVYSSEFIYNGIPSFFGEDGAGNMFIYQQLSTGRNILVPIVGSVNYQTGLVTIDTVVVDGFSGDGIRFFAVPRNKDIMVSFDTIIRIDLQNTNIVVNDTV